MSEVKEGGIPLSEYEKDGGVNRGTKHEIHEEDQNEQADYTGDAALANASWQFKTIALITALMLPSMLIWYINITKMTFYTYLQRVIVGSHFSASALSAMKSPLKTV